jgi:hypothetical protein
MQPRLAESWFLVVAYFVFLFSFLGGSGGRAKGGLLQASNARWYGYDCYARIDPMNQG